MNLLRFSGIAITAFFAFVNIQFWHFFWLGWIMLPLFLWLASEGVEGLMVRYFGFLAGPRSKLMGILFVLAILGIFCGALAIFWKLTALSLCLIMVWIGAVSASVSSVDSTPVKDDPDSDDVVVLTNRKYYWVAFVVLIVFGLFSLWRVRTGAAMDTPWRIIPSNFVYIVFLSMLTLGGLIFSRIKTSWLLFFIILQFALCLFYLPLTHKMLWGADGWRHIAVMEQIRAEQPLQITNYAANPNWMEKINPGQFAYSQFWGAGVALARILQIDFVPLLAWWQPLLAALLLPILFFEFGLALNLSRRKSLVLAWFGLWPFALQMAGAFSLPVNFGFLFFLAILLLILRRAGNPNRTQVWILSILLVLSIFSYSLFTLLFAVAWAMSELLRRVQTSEKVINKNVFFVLLVTAGVLLLPAVELVAGYANFTSLNTVWSGLKQFAGNLFGYYLASGPRTHIIETGNIFFNQVPSYAFVSNGFTVWRWWIIFFMSLAVVGLIFGLVKLSRSADVRFQLLSGLCISVFGGYVISRYLLAGEHLLTRRLEAIVAFFCILIIFYSIQNVFEKNQFVTLLLILVVPAVAAASLSLGPVSRAMSADEYRAAENVWQNIQADDKKCVVADTYPLLALEAISHKAVVGGGFPIDKNFGQAELTAIYNEIVLSSQSSIDINKYHARASEITGASTCYLITFSTNISSTSIAEIGVFDVYKF